MPPKFDSLLYPNDKMNTMRRAMKAAGVANVPTNREGRRRLNRELVKLGAPELQVEVGVKASKEEPQRVFLKPEVIVPLSIEDMPVAWHRGSATGGSSTKCTLRQPQLCWSRVERTVNPPCSTRGPWKKGASGGCR